MDTLKNLGLRTSIVALCLLVNLPSACVPAMPGNSNNVPSSMGDGGFLSSNPCGPPCFQGIIPGTTTEHEAVQILQSQGLYYNCSSFNNEVSSGKRGVECGSSASISFQRGTDIVDAVSFGLSQKVTVADVIAKYGEPDTVLVALDHRYPRAGMNLYYTDLRAIIGLPDQEGSIFRVSASTMVESIAYLSTASYKFHVPAIDSLPKWKGYGEYKEYLP
jgi:hypothetical protein